MSLFFLKALTLFIKGENPNAKGKWLDNWLPGGGEADFAPNAFKSLQEGEWCVMLKTTDIREWISFKGKRSVGDVGNDYIAGLAWKFGQDVMTKFEWTMISGAKLSGIVVINVTTPGGGDTTNLDTLEFEAIFYGKPTFTAAATL